MTFQERLMQLSQEMSSAKAQYTALHKEMDRRVLSGGDITALKKDRDEMFNFYNSLVREHQSIIQHLRKNNLRAGTIMPEGFGTQ